MPSGHIGNLLECLRDRDWLRRPVRSVAKILELRPDLECVLLEARGMAADGTGSLLVERIDRLLHTLRHLDAAWPGYEPLTEQDLDELHAYVGLRRPQEVVRG